MDYVGAAGTLSDIDLFEADLFGFTPLAASTLDPQHRLFLHCAWEAFEDAGIAPGLQDEIVGAFVGCGVNAYLLNNLWSREGLSRPSTLVGSAAELQLLMAGMADFLPARLAYHFNLRGPVMNVQSACSTSLVAVHLACQSLSAGECDIALAGCSTVRVPHDIGHQYTEGAPFSRDGHTRCFDAEAGGTVFGSGVGAVMLKPLDTALADGDPIHALIRASAVNNDGRRRAGFTAPGLEGQVAVLEEALALADFPPGSVDLIEAHGTATAIGDRIEVEALRRAYRTFASQPCFLGSVKANIGHLSWSAGMAGLIKTVLALKHGEIPPNIHLQTSLAELEDEPFTVNRLLAPWPATARPRRAAVSAFGLGGTNAHLILEQAPAAPVKPLHSSETALLALSARTSSDLARLADRYADCLDRLPDEDLPAVCRTAAIGRRHFDKRLAIVGRTTGEVRDALKRHADPASAEHADLGQVSPIAFLFTGQGAHPAGVGAELYAAVPEFRQVLDQCDRKLSAVTGRGVLDVLADPGMWEDLSLAYPAHFAFQCALATAWSAWGIRPDYVMGHSAGEYAAACTAGVMRLEDGLVLARRRGLLFQDEMREPGAMATVQASSAQVEPFIDAYRDAISIAAENGPLSTVISGRAAEMTELLASLSRRGFRTEGLAVSRAGHSPLVEPLLAGLGEALRDVALAPPSIPIVGNVTGKLVQAEMATADYWVRQSRDTVRFSAGIETLSDLGVDTYLEIGPSTTLLGLAAFCRDDRTALCLPSLRPFSSGRSDRELPTMLKTLGELYTRGAAVNWQGLPGMRSGRRLHLPPSPLKGKRYWIDAPPPAAPEPASAADGIGSSGMENRERLADAFVEIAWHAEDLAPGGSRERVAGTWLLVGGNQADAESFSRRIATSGGACRHVPLSDLPALASILAETADAGPNVVLLPNVLEVDDDISAEALCEQTWRCCEPQAAVARALARLGLDSSLWIVTRSAQGESTPERLPEAASWAVGRVLAMEHPALSVAALDIGEEEPWTAAEHFIAEVRNGGPPASTAWRGGQRFVARLRRCVDPPKGPMRYRDDSVYAFVGGLGDVGLTVARHAVEGGARHLLLIGRRPPGSSARRAVADLERAGATVSVEIFDITDRDALRASFERAALRRPVRGIFHLAGRLDDQLLTEIDRDRFMSVLRPKLGGAWNLHLVAAEIGLQLDFFVMFSSATAMVGNGGQASHAAANAALDRLAHHRAALGLPAQSVAWGVWSDVGKLRDATALRKKLELAGFGMIGTEAGLAALDDAMAGGLPHIGIIPADWNRFVRHHLIGEIDYYRDLHTVAEAAAAGSPPPRLDELARLDSAGRRERLSALVAELVAELTGERFDPCRQGDLRSAGLDSLGLVQLCGHLRNRLDIAIPLNEVMVEPTLPRIIDNLVHRLERGPIAPSSSEPATGGAAPVCLSTHQERWLSLIAAGYGLRVVPILFSERLDRTSFRKALLRLVERHALLRLVFDPVKPRLHHAQQCVPADDRLFLDFGAVDSDERRRRLGEWVEAAYDAPPDPQRECSWSIACLDGPGESFMVLLVVQHLEFDGTGLTTFAQELDLLYAAERRGAPPRLEAIAPYEEFARDQRAYEAGEIVGDRAFFQGLYSHLGGLTRLPGHPGFDRTCPLLAKRWTVLGDAPTADALRQKARALGVTPFSIILTAYGQLVAALTGEAEVVVSMITSCRTDPRFERTIGPFTSPYPVPLLAGGLPSDALVQRCQRTVSGIISRTRYPVTDLTQHVPPFVGLPRETYFSDVGINFTNYRKSGRKNGSGPRVVEILGPVDDPQLAGLAPRELRRVPGLHLVVDSDDDGLRFNFWYHFERFSEPTVQSWGERFAQLLDETLA